MQLHVGTSGFAYKAWKGPFYPEDLPQKEMLRFYASQLPAVEINNTFYRLPKASVVESWAAQVPDHFRFVIKASRRITHSKRLKEAGDETSYLLSTLASLGEKLGAVLFQLPPNLACDLPRLERFLASLPEGTPSVFEFRHASWQDDAVLACLREHDAALCLAESDDSGAPELVSTAPTGYLRLRRAAYTPGELAEWAARVRTSGWRDVFVFFKHEDEGAGPRAARDFLALAGRSAARVRPATAEAQGAV